MNASWFSRPRFLQPSLLPGDVGTVDLGLSTIGSDATIYRHLQGQVAFSGLSNSTNTAITQQSTTDIGLDPTSFLPTVPAYSVHPDNGAQTPIAIKIHYSNYQVVNGVRIPFHIQRYVNGSLQLDVLVSAAQVN